MAEDRSSSKKIEEKIRSGRLQRAARKRGLDTDRSREGCVYVLGVLDENKK
jgi:hypothetical protein